MARDARFQPSADGEAKNKTVASGTQNNAVNSYYFSSSQNNNNKTNSILAIPFFAYTELANLRTLESMHEYVTIEAVNEGYKDCKKYKASTEGCVEYMQNYLANNLQLYYDLNNMTYEIGQSKAFCVRYPRLREVFCAKFRDRVVHHILAMKFMDVFEPEMTDNAYACRKGKGTLYGINHIKEQIESVSKGYTVETWILKCDLQGFFMSIDRRMVYGIVEDIVRRRYCGEDTEQWLWLWKKVILHDPTKNCIKVGDTSLWDRLPKNKSLFTCGEGKGLPIGNLPSQIMANLLLSILDKRMTERLGENCGYGRYVDDFVMISKDKQLLLNVLSDTRKFLRDELMLTLHPDKFYLQEVRKGVTFTGTVIKPGRTYTNNKTVGHLFEIIREWNMLRNVSEEQTRRFINSVNSMFGCLRQTNGYAIRWEAWKAMGHKDRIYCKNMTTIKSRHNGYEEKTNVCQHNSSC